MKVEIVGNYPKYREKDKDGHWKVVGTFHAYLPDYDLDLRGIHYLWKKGKVYIRYPSRKGYAEGLDCDYLLYSFCSADKQKDFTKALKTALVAFSKSDEFDKKCREVR